MLAVITEKIEMICDIGCTHNGIELPKFNLAHLLWLYSCGIWHKLDAGNDAELAANCVERPISHGMAAPRTVDALLRHVGSTLGLAANRLDQSDLDINIVK